MTAVSLFAGISGFDLALRARDWVKVVASVEIDKARAGCTARTFPKTVSIFGDIQEVSGEQAH
jgi:site-specific DNA-cytosine methylase